MYHNNPSLVESERQRDRDKETSQRDREIERQRIVMSHHMLFPARVRGDGAQDPVPLG